MPTREDELKKLIDDNQSQISELIDNLPGSAQIIEDEKQIWDLIDQRVKYNVELAELKRTQRS